MALVMYGTWLVYAAILHPLGGLSSPPSGQPAARLEISVVKRSVTLPEPVVLRYTIINDSADTLRANLGYDRIAAFEFDLVAPDGARQVARPQLRHIGDHPSRPDEVVLPPGARYEQSIVLHEWLPFPVAGTYRLRVRFQGLFAVSEAVGKDPIRDSFVGDARRPPAPHATLPDQNLTILVLHRDEQRLEATLKSLAERMRLPFTPEFNDAVVELIHFVDPVAVPYLEAALEREISHRFAETLGRIGTPAARQALERLAAHQTDWVSANARAALARMK